MKIVLIVIGKTKEQYLIEGIFKYQERINYYTKCEFFEIPNIKNSKNLSYSEIRKKEGELILQGLKPSDYLVVLDDKGKEFTSIKFAEKIQSWMFNRPKRLVFLIGGAYGFSNAVYDRGNEKVSLSKMTFSHQMVRLFILEQIYRGYTILNNEPYHNQ